MLYKYCYAVQKMVYAVQSLVNVMQYKYCDAVQKMVYAVNRLFMQYKDWFFSTKIGHSVQRFIMQ
jgi:hypothetical protein